MINLSTFALCVCVCSLHCALNWRKKCDSFFAKFWRDYANRNREKAFPLGSLMALEWYYEVLLNIKR